MYKFVLFLFFCSADAVQLQDRTSAEVAANPVRKVVTMLQNMVKQVTAEGKKEEGLYHKFMCYCETGAGSLSASIDAATEKVGSAGSELKAATEKKAQTEADLKKHQGGRADAKDAMAKATGVREKEAAAFAKESADLTANIAATKKAIAAIENGMGGFLQTQTAAMVKSFVMDRATLGDADRQELLSFLSGELHEGYAPASGEIVGILKQMEDEMSASLKDATNDENSSISENEGLMAAKKKEVSALSKQIEIELKRVGDLGVAIASLGNDIEDTQESLAQDQEFLKNLDASCKTKTGDWEAIKKTRTEELKALSETIKVLNDDDALELFKKTLPTPASSFLQVQVSKRAMRSRALAIIRSAKSAGGPELDLLSLAISGKKIGFGKVLKMIDEMVANLKAEQQDDNEKKEYCSREFDLADDKKKELELSISDSETAIDEMKGSIAKLAEEVAALEDGVKALDKSVAEATSQRKDDNEDFKQLMANDAAAKELLLFAKNRLNKFYNPKLYKAPPKRDLSEEERITVNMGGTLAPTSASGIADTGISVGFVQLSARAARRGVEAPPPPPETFGAYSKKSEKGGGVIAMIDLLVADLDKEMTEAKVEEKDSQSDYASMMDRAAKKRAQDSKAITEKSAASANMKESLEAEKDSKTSATKELGATLQAIHGLHGECDWLLKYFDVRTEARTGEIESLGKAKDVLNGADFSF